MSVPCAIIRYYAALARELSVKEAREAISFTGRTVVRREPTGVAAVIASWSYPLILAFRQLAPALGAGCTVVLPAGGPVSWRSPGRCARARRGRQGRSGRAMAAQGSAPGW